MVRDEAEEPPRQKTFDAVMPARQKTHWSGQSSGSLEDGCCGRGGQRGIARTIRARSTSECGVPVSGAEAREPNVNVWPRRQIAASKLQNASSGCPQMIRDRSSSHRVEGSVVPRFGLKMVLQPVRVDTRHQGILHEDENVAP